MQYEKIEQDYFIHIEKNEKVMHSLTKFCKANGIQNGTLSVSKIDLGVNLLKVWILIPLSHKNLLYEDPRPPESPGPSKIIQKTIIKKRH